MLSLIWRRGQFTSTRNARIAEGGLLALSGTASAYVLRWATTRMAAGRARTAARARRREFMVD